MPSKLIVAFRTRLVDDKTLIPSADDLSPPSNYKDEAKIAKWREEQQEKLEVDALQQPYTATFDEVRIADLANERVSTFKYRDPDDPRPCASIAIRNWLLSEYPDAWPNTLILGRPSPRQTSPLLAACAEMLAGIAVKSGLKLPARIRELIDEQTQETAVRPRREQAYPPIFVGFNPRLFLKILGIECSLPANQPEDPTESSVLPLSLWYTNSDHRDIGHAVMPSDYKYLNWKTVLQARNLAKEAEGWTGPGVNVEQDLMIATDLAAQLGFLSEEAD